MFLVEESSPRLFLVNLHSSSNHFSFFVFFGLLRFVNNARVSNI